MSGIVERLRAIRIVDIGDDYLENPDGPEAAVAIEVLVEACFKARHRLLKEGFLPEDPTVRAINAAIDKVQS